MSGNFSIPSNTHRVLNQDGTMSRVWYLYLQQLAGSAGAPQVSTVSAESRPAANPGFDENELGHQTTRVAAAPDSATRTATSEHDTEPPQGPSNIMAIVQQVLQDGGYVPGGGGGGGSAVSKTSSYVVVVGDTGTQFDNYGASGPVTFTLPPWAAALNFTFIVLAPQNVVVAASGGDNIAVNTQTFVSATSSALYSVLRVSSGNAPGVWAIASTTGGWNYA